MKASRCGSGWKDRLDYVHLFLTAGLEGPIRREGVGDAKTPERKALSRESKKKKKKTNPENTRTNTGQNGDRNL